jgi:hypothetical protein
MAGPNDEIISVEGAGRAGLRASDAEREQVIGALKAAFVDGRLTGDELDARVDQVYAARTHGDLASVVADLPTALIGARRRRRDPWRATKRAWRFEYSALLPGVVAVILLPGGPHVTGWTLLGWAAVIYPVFWALGAAKVVANRRLRSATEQPAPALSWYERDKVSRILRAALTQGRLTEDEHDARAGLATASESGAELAAVVGDLPADLVARRPKARDAWTGISVSTAAASVIALLFLLQPDNYPAFALAVFSAAVVILAPPVTVGLVVDALQQKRAARQLRLGPAPS